MESIRDAAASRAARIIPEHGTRRLAEPQDDDAREAVARHGDWRMDEVIDTYELAPLQQGMLFHAISERNRGVDIEQIIVATDAPLDLAVFAGAWQRIIDRHTILRTRLRWEDVAEPRQEVVRASSSCRSKPTGAAFRPISSSNVSQPRSPPIA